MTPTRCVSGTQSDVTHRSDRTIQTIDAHVPKAPYHSVIIVLRLRRPRPPYSSAASDEHKRQEFHYGKEYGGRVHEERNSTRAQLVLDATALERTPHKKGARSANGH